MIFFEKTTSWPRSLESFSSSLRDINDTINAHMMLPAKERAQTDIPAIWKIPFQDDVRPALMDISGNRCAFCEMQSHVSVYRFRPPAFTQPKKPAEGEQSYLWLSFDWKNLFPICESCRPIQQNYFPVNGMRAGFDMPDPSQENAVLIAPGELTQPYRHFLARSDGTLEGLTNRARTTIKHFRLNEDKKPYDRTLRLSNFTRLLQSPQPIPSDPVRRTENGFWYLYLRRIIGNILETRGGSQLSRSPAAINKTIETLARESGFARLLKQALSAVRIQDDFEQNKVNQSKVDALYAAPSKPAHYPRILSVELSTYKSLEEIKFTMAPALADTTRARLTAVAASTASIPEAPCVLILGENATGKSSILEAIALTLMPANQRTQLKLNASHLTLNPEYMGAPGIAPERRSKITISFHPEATDESSEPRQITLDIDGGANAVVAFQEGGDRTRVLPPLFAYGAHRLYGNIKKRSSLRHIETLFHNDRQLPKPETWLRKLKEDDLNEVARAVRHIIQIDGTFETIEIDKTTDQCKINIKKQTATGENYVIPQRLDIVSSGYRAVFALVCDVLEGLAKHTQSDIQTARNTPAIVLIDEIEAHLHPRWKLHVITGLRRALPKVTFIITSHDPLCVRGMFDGEVLALNRYQNIKQEGLRLPERVERVEGFENVETLTIEQLLTSELFQLLSTDSPQLDHAFAQAADTLAESSDAGAVELGIISDALPYGQTDLARLVQEAVTDYLVERRNRKADANVAAREEAKEAIKDLLRKRMQ